MKAHNGILPENMLQTELHKTLGGNLINMPLNLLMNTEGIKLIICEREEIWAAIQCHAEVDLRVAN